MADLERMNNHLCCGELYAAWNVYNRNRCLLTDDFWQGICRIASEGDPSSDDHECWTYLFWRILSEIYSTIKQKEVTLGARIATLLAKMFEDGRRIELDVEIEIFYFIREVYKQKYEDTEARKDFFRTIMVNEYSKEIVFSPGLCESELKFQAYINDVIATGSTTKSANKN